jgi:hypothetical protein
LLLDKFTEWPKTTPNYYLAALQLGHPIQPYWIKIKGSAELDSFLEDPEKKYESWLFPSSIPWLMTLMKLLRS